MIAIPLDKYDGIVVERYGGEVYFIFDLVYKRTHMEFQTEIIYRIPGTHAYVELYSNLKSNKPWRSMLRL